jgi:hypothetical protein
VIVLSSVALLSVAVPSVQAGAAAPASLRHPVVCEGTVETPFRSGTRIYGYGSVRCTSPTDLFTMRVQLQRRENGIWRNYGAPVFSTTPTTYRRLGDWVYCPGVGYYSYRTVLVWQGFHGSWDSDTRYSRTFLTNC